MASLGDSCFRFSIRRLSSSSYGVAGFLWNSDSWEDAGESMKILVCGDRSWTDGKLIEKEILKHKPVTCIISGEATGADTCAKEIAHRKKFRYKGFPANWNKYGKAAGPIRNQQMLDEGKPDLVLAFHDNLEHSKGTKDMVARAEKAGVKVKKISHNGAKND